MIEFFKTLKKFLGKKKKALSGILAGMMIMSMIPTIVTVSIGLALFGAIGYYVTSFDDKKEEEEDDSARVASASDIDCNCTLVYDGKQFVNGYDSSILNGTGANINSGSTGSSVSGASGGAGMTNNKGESTAMGEKIAQTARNQPPIPYVYGGSHSLGCENTWKNGADCSSETYYNLKEAGINVGSSGVPTSYTFRSLGTEVASWDEMLPGDVICAPGHVCTYIGNNEIWNSGGSGDHSKIIKADYYKNKVVTIRRFATDVTVASSGNNGANQSSGNFKKFTLNDNQLIRLTRLCIAEQSVLDGVRAEASLIANLYDLNVGGSGKMGASGNYNDLDDWANNCGWFGFTSGSNGGKTSIMDVSSGKVYSKKGNARNAVPDSEVTSTMIEAVRNVLVNGNRALPNYIDEHDSINDIKSMTIDGVAVAKDKTAMYNALYAGKVVYVKFSGSPYRIAWVGKIGNSYTDGFGYHDSVYDKYKASNNIILPKSSDALAPWLGTSDGGSSTATGIGNGIIGNNNTSTNTGIGAGIIGNNATSNKISLNLNTSTGSTGSTGGLSSSTSNKLGKYIENTDGMPLYDGYTFDSSKVEYFDLNYKQFWDGTTPQDDWLYNLGNFADAYGTNAVTYETRDATVRKREVKNGEIIEDGRWVMASPMRILALDDPANDAYWERSKDPSNYTKPNGNNSDPPVLGDPVKYIGYSQGVYYDVVLDDGSVLPMISGDAKAMHYGDYPRSTGNESFYRCDKSLGYAHVVAKPHQKDVFYNQCIFEVCGNSNAGGKQAANLLKGKFLKGKKVVSIRVYKNMYRKQSKDVYTDWFSSGTDSSFGLTGGSASGNADWAGIGSVGSTGSTGTALTGTNGALKFNSDGTICINCTCEGDCKCHSARAGSTGNASESAGSSGSATISKSLESTPGVPQGIYYNWAEQRQYTSDEMYNLFKTQFPNLFAKYQPTFGWWHYYDTSETKATYDGDRWTELFGEIGIIPYDQAENNGSGQWQEQQWHIGLGSNRYLDSTVGGRFGSNACGLCSRAIVVSTMLHRIVTPTECLMAIALSPTLSSSGYKGNYHASGDSNAFLHTDSAVIFDSFVYKGKNLFSLEYGGSTDEAKINEVLGKGGMVIGVTHNNADGWCGSGHYIVITGKDSNGLYREADSSAKARRKNPNDNTSMFKGHTLAEWQKRHTRSGKTFDQFTYVTPGPGYAEYIKDVFGKDI